MDRNSGEGFFTVDGSEIPGPNHLASIKHCNINPCDIYPTSTGEFTKTGFLVAINSEQYLSIMMKPS